MKRKSRLLTLTFLLLATLFCSQSMNAQQLMAADQAMEQLEIKLAEIDQQARQGQISADELKLAQTFVYATAEKISSGQSVAAALESAKTLTEQKYAGKTSQINALRQKFTTTLQQ